MKKDKLFELDDKTFEAVMECLVKEKEFRESTKITKKKRKENIKLFEQLMEDDLKKKGYIK